MYLQYSTCTENAPHLVSGCAHVTIQVWYAACTAEGRWGFPGRKILPGNPGADAPYVCMYAADADGESLLVM